MFLIHSEPSLNDYVSVQEYDRSTPAKYSDDQQILFYQSEGVSININGLLPGNITGDKKATLIIASDNLALWIPELQTGLSIPYTQVILHASQTEPETGVYLQVAVAEDEKTIEIFIENKEHEKIYEALSECSSLHPDDENSENESLIGEQLEIPEYLCNTDGQADDDIPIQAGNGSAHDDGTEETTAGIEVEIPHQIRAGIRRAHIEEEDPTKWRRTE